MNNKIDFSFFKKFRVFCESDVIRCCFGPPTEKARSEETRLFFAEQINFV